jgi:hypothetical protein
VRKLLLVALAVLALTGGALVAMSAFTTEPARACSPCGDGGSIVQADLPRASRPRWRRSRHLIRGPPRVCLAQADAGGEWDMSDTAVSGTQPSDIAERFQRPPPVDTKQPNHWKWITIAVLILIIAAVCGLVYYLFRNPTPPNISLANEITLSIILTALPLLICYVQTTSIARQLDKLHGLEGRAVTDTVHYKNAIASLEYIKQVFYDQFYSIPIITFAVITLYCSLMTTVAYFDNAYFQSPNVILGAFQVIKYIPALLNPSEPGHLDAVQQVDAIQRATFVAGCFGFIGAYLYILWRLLDRINNNDIYPITFYFYSARILTATLVAGVISQIIPASPNYVAIIICSFVVGFVPDVFITWLVRRLARSQGSKNYRDDCRQQRPFGDVEAK